jgi:hypothetical protein
MDHEALAASERRIHVGPRVDSRAPVGALAQSERWFLSKASRGHRAPAGRQGRSAVEALGTAERRLGWRAEALGTAERRLGDVIQVKVQIVLLRCGMKPPYTDA